MRFQQKTFRLSAGLALVAAVMPIGVSGKAPEHTDSHNGQSLCCASSTWRLDPGRQLGRGELLARPADPCTSRFNCTGHRRLTSNPRRGLHSANLRRSLRQMF